MEKENQHNKIIRQPSVIKSHQI